MTVTVTAPRRPQPQGFQPSLMAWAQARTLDGVASGDIRSVEGLMALSRTTPAEQATFLTATTRLLLDLDADLVGRLGEMASRVLIANAAGRFSFHPAGRDEADVLLAPLPDNLGKSTILCLLLRTVRDLTGFEVAEWARLVEVADSDPALVRRGVAVGLTSSDGDWRQRLRSDEVAVLAALRGFPDA